MPKIKYKVTLSREEREELQSLTKNGKRSSRKVIQALILLNADEGAFTEQQKRTGKDIAEFLQTGERTIDRIKKGLQSALEDKPAEREYRQKIDWEAEAHLIALSCGETPEGFARWSLRMLADKAVELHYVDSVSHETIRRV